MKNIETFYPLSPLQKGLLFHAVFAPESGVYFQQLGCTIDGPLDAGAWKRAWQRVVDHHPVMRTGFLWEGLKEPVQVVHKSAELPVREEDWRALAPAERQRRFAELLEEDRRRGFDLARPPLMRLALLRTAERSYHFVWSHHHLLLDGWSAQLLLRDVFACYEALRREETPALTEPRPYRDYITWLQRQDAARAESFWRAYLKGFGAPTPLGAHANGDGNNHGGGALVDTGLQEQEHFKFTAAETERLQAFARGQRLTLNTLMQGAWALMLARYSGTQDVLFGATVSGRPAGLAGVEQMVGLFINALPVRVEVAGGLAVSEWLRGLQERGAEAREFEYTPLQEVQRWSEVGRGQSLFESLFIFKNYPSDGASKGGGNELEISDVQTFERTNYPLCVSLSADAELDMTITYDGERFTPEAIRRMAEHLRTLLREMTADPARRVSELRLETVEGYRLSPQQEHLWLVRQHGGGRAPRAVCEVALRGDLRPELLRAAVEQTTARHEILRTEFRKLAGMSIPLQVIAERARPRLREHDLGERPAAEREELVASLLREAESSSSSAEGEAAPRVELISLGADDRRMIVSLPALCADEAGLANLVGEIARAYEARLDGAELSDEPLNYVVFSEWQNELLESDESREGREFWRARDLSRLAAARLPFEQNNAGAPFEPRPHRLEIDEHTTALVESLASSRGVSVGELLLACWQILLSRLTAEHEIGVGLGCDGRTDAELERALGLFARYLPLAYRFEPHLTLGEALRSAAEASREAYQWQDCFSWRDVAPPEGATGDAPFIPFCFDFGTEPAAFEAGGARFTITERHACTDRFRVRLKGVRTAHALALDFYFDAACYQTEDIARLAGRFEHLLRDAVNSPDAKLYELDILGEREREWLLAEFNSTAYPHDSAKCLHELFEAQAAATPDNVALVSGHDEITYRDLNERANRLAHHLRALGVGPDSLVGVMLERSPELVVALLGALKAGAAYLPLDADYPPERLRFMLDDAGLSVLLTHSSLLGRLPAGHACVCLDTEWPLIARRPAHDPAPAASAESLAYVLYTSGSTGRPKGVMIPHRAIANHMLWMGRRFPLGHREAVLQKTPVSFDASVWEFYAPLLAGARLVLAEPGGHREAGYIIEAVGRHGVTTLQVVPSMLRVLAEEAGLGGCVTLRRLFCGGEALASELSARVRERLSGASLINVYGPTEAAIDATYHECGGEVAGVGSAATEPIGRPVDNARGYVLGGRGELVPVGVPGELYLGGDGLGRGYLKRPALTAERFVPDPYSAEPGGRLYRTGDLVRHLPGGGLEYLGRLDHQVKVRGFRIELGEIEAALAEHEAVRDCAVLAREGENGTCRLVAYVVAHEGAGEGLVGEWQRHLKGRLSEYMVPSAFVVLDALPLTPNGKVDRKALPALEPSRPDAEQSFVQPQTPVEQTLAGIWAAVLRVEKVGTGDNFFELGGDSILSLQVVARANQAGLRLTPKQLFDNPTVAQLSAVVGAARQTAHDEGTGELPLTPIQRLFFEQELPELHHYNQASLFEVRSEFDAERLEGAVNHLFAHHDALRLRFTRAEGGWRQRVEEAETHLPLARVDLSGAADDELPAAIERAAAGLHASLDIERGPLARVAFFDLGGGRPGRLFIVIHHLAVDGVSWRILLEDLQAAYEQLGRGEAVKLPPKTTSFRRWAELLREHARGEELLREADYWLDASRALAPPLPVDFEGGDNTEASARTLTLSLDEGQTRALLQEVPAAYHTQINDVLLTALARAFGTWTGERRLLVDLEGHGREELAEGVDLTRTVGWFTTVFPVLLEFERGAGEGQALRSIKEQLRAVPRRGIGYGLLRYLSDDAETARRLAELPAAEVCFNYLGQWDQLLADESSLVPAKESNGPARSGRGARAYLLDVSGGVSGGRLNMRWTYSENVYERATVERLARSFMEALGALITHCRSADAGGFTPSDFPRANLKQKELDKLLARIGQVK